MNTKYLIGIMRELSDPENTKFKDYVTKAYMQEYEGVFKEIVKRLEEYDEIKNKLEENEELIEKLYQSARRW